ncbi:hypothetical protein RIR_jg36552.t1 [Rhizophagus irregularis DAOM 181602=DAOM 197198]|nr:hypothetical protein RIR_jg36552.t1 [Rhizophagus irregularis DAOM 181602=DAOM 197198]
MSQLEPSQGLVQLGSAWLVPKAHKLAHFQNHIKFIITKISKRDNFANIAPNLMILLPLDSSHQEESNGSKFIKFGAILAKLSRFKTLVLIFNKSSQASTKPSYNCSLVWLGLVQLKSSQAGLAHIEH